MQTKVATKNLLKEFNKFFEGKAKAAINRNMLEITINGATLIVSLPEVIGGQSDDRET